MPKITVCIDVPDKEKAIQFYTKGLGCELVKQNSDYVELNTDGLTIYLSKQAPGTNPLIQEKAVRSYERHWTPVHLDFIVSNIEECITTVLEYGGVKEGSKNGDWGSAVFCSDPFGNGFCILEYNQ